MNRLILFIAAIAFVGCGKAKRCYQCKTTILREPTYRNTTDERMMCDMSKDDIQAYIDRSASNPNIKIDCTR